MTRGERAKPIGRQPENTSWASELHALSPCYSSSPSFHPSFFIDCLSLLITHPLSFSLNMFSYSCSLSFSVFCPLFLLPSFLDSFIFLPRFSLVNYFLILPIFLSCFHSLKSSLFLFTFLLFLSYSLGLLPRFFPPSSGPHPHFLSVLCRLLLSSGLTPHSFPTFCLSPPL